VLPPDHRRDKLVVMAVRHVAEPGGEVSAVAAGVGDRLDGGGERAGRHGVSLGPLLPGVEGVEEALDLGELAPVEVVEVGAWPVRVGGCAESTDSYGELIEAPLHRCAAGLDRSDVSFGVVDGALGLSETVTGAAPAAGAGVTFVVCGVPQRRLQALAELLVDLGDLGGVGRPRGVGGTEVGLERGQVAPGLATPIGGLVELGVQVVSSLDESMAGRLEPLGDLRSRLAGGSRDLAGEVAALGDGGDVDGVVGQDRFEDVAGFRGIGGVG
jgi:hypothetical protein